MTQKNIYTVCYISIVTMMTASFVILLSTIHSNKALSRENEAYNIFQTCALSVMAEQRTNAKIDSCWKQAEMLTGLKIQRFDK